MTAAVPLRIIILTQNDVFFLPRALDILLRRLPGTAEVVGAVVLAVSPFGKKRSFTQRVLDTWSIFGTRFFLHYALRYLWARARSQDVNAVFRRHDINILEASGSVNDKAFIEKIEELKPDVLVSLSANEILRDKIISVAPLGIINLHTSLLPLNRGLMPSFWVLANGEKETGVSVFQVDDGIDSGPILAQKRIALGDISQWDLIRATKLLGMEAVVEALEGLRKGTTRPDPNLEHEATYNRFPTRADVRKFRKRGARFF